MSESDRITQAEKAIIGLRGLVMSGAFEPGARLPEVALAERLNISRTPLRQAMDRLVSESLLERIATGGCRVASFDFDDLTDAIELRGVIEGTAARRAAERGIETDQSDAARCVLAEIDTVVADVAAIDLDRYARLNAEFHSLLAEMSGSDLICREIDRINRLPMAAPSAFLSAQEGVPNFFASLSRAQEQHHSILDAIEAREGTRAEALMREHARLARRNLNFLKDADPRVATQVPGMSLVTAN